MKTFFFSFRGVCSIFFGFVGLYVFYENMFFLLNGCLLKYFRLCYFFPMLIYHCSFILTTVDITE